MQNVRQFDAVIFDLDGTLLDTIDDIADSVNAAISSMGHPMHSIKEYKLMVGEGIRHLVKMALPDPARSDQAAIEECVKRTGDEYFKRWNLKTKPYEGIPELLDSLVERDMKLAILSNKPHDFTVMSVGELLPKWRFEMVLGARDGVPAKPDPTAAFEIAKSLGIAPERTLFLGDSGIDMQTALSAGMHPIGVLWGFRSSDELQSAGALSLVSKPSEIIGLLG